MPIGFSYLILLLNGTAFCLELCQQVTTSVYLAFLFIKLVILKLTAKSLDYSLKIHNFVKAMSWLSMILTTSSALGNPRRGARGVHPLSVYFFQFHAFWGIKWPKQYVGIPPLGFPLLRGKFWFLFKWFQNNSVILT